MSYKEQQDIERWQWQWPYSNRILALEAKSECWLLALSITTTHILVTYE